jgi:methylglutaconyl-CoA hydratase
MRTCRKIVVVRVQGKTTGGGVGIACAADYCFATENASLALTEINLGIGPFVIGPYVERKIGKSQFTAMAIDADFRSANWAEQHNIYHSVSPTIAEMDSEITQFLEKLASRSSDALALIKKVSWEGTEHFEKLMPERILMSASLILEDTAKKNIEKIKENLRAK